MKRIDTDGIAYIEPVPGGTSEWYFGVSQECGDLYEAEEIYRDGRTVKGNRLCLVRYPDGRVFRPVPEEEGTCFENPVFLNGCIYILRAEFVKERICIFRFDCEYFTTDLVEEIPLGSVRNCYNLKLHTAPLCLTRQGDEGHFEILYPEKVCFMMDPHESFFMREGQKLYFSKWYEEGSGADYRYWEETVVRNLDGTLEETFPGDFRIMPDGEIWYLC